MICGWGVTLGIVRPLSIIGGNLRDIAEGEGDVMEILSAQAAALKKEVGAFTA